MYTSINIFLQQSRTHDNMICTKTHYGEQKETVGYTK